MRPIFTILSIAILLLGCTKSPYQPNPEPPEIWHTVFMIEILSNNASIRTDEFGEFDDYVVIYNPQDTSVILSGWGLSDRSDSIRYEFIAPSLLFPDSTMLIWCDGQPEQGFNHAGFRISADGEWVGIIDAEGNMVDSVSVPPLLPDSAYVRDFETLEWSIGPAICR